MAEENLEEEVEARIYRGNRSEWPWNMFERKVFIRFPGRVMIEYKVTEFRDDAKDKAHRQLGELADLKQPPHGLLRTAEADAFGVYRDDKFSEKREDKDLFSYRISLIGTSTSAVLIATPKVPKDLVDTIEREYFGKVSSSLDLRHAIISVANQSVIQSCNRVQTLCREAESGKLAPLIKANIFNAYYNFPAIAAAEQVMSTAISDYEKNAVEFVKAMKQLHDCYAAMWLRKALGKADDSGSLPEYYGVLDKD